MNFLAILFFFTFSILILRVSSAPQKRIINGHDTEDLPGYVAFIIGYTFTHNTYGGGSFVTPRHILTSPLLVENAYQVAVGTGATLYDKMYFTAVYSYVIHPQFNKETFEYSIAIIDMESDYFISVVDPIPLPSVPNTPFVNEQGKISSFSMASSTQQLIIDNEMKSGYFRRIDDSECNQKLNIPLPSTGFCAQDLDNESSLCYGDLGTGMTLHIDEVNTLVGVVTVFTNKCNRDFPAIFTKVAPFVDWINAHIL